MRKTVRFSPAICPRSPFVFTKANLRIEATDAASRPPGNALRRDICTSHVGRVHTAGPNASLDPSFGRFLLGRGRATDKKKRRILLEPEKKKKTRSSTRFFYFVIPPGKGRRGQVASKSREMDACIGRGKGAARREYDPCARRKRSRKRGALSTCVCVEYFTSSQNQLRDRRHRGILSARARRFSAPVHERSPGVTLCQKLCRGGAAMFVRLGLVYLSVLSLSHSDAILQQLTYPQKVPQLLPISRRFRPLTSSRRRSFPDALGVIVAHTPL